MVTNTTVRAKDKGYQAIVRFREKNNIKWKHYKSKQGFKKKKEAEMWGKEQEAELLKNNPVIDDITEDITLGQAINLFLSFKKSRVKYNTYNGFIVVFRKLKEYENIQLKSLTPLKLQNIVDSVPATMQKRLKTFLNFLIEKELIKPFKVSFKKYQKNKKPVIVSDELFNEIMQSEIPEHLKVFSFVAINTGMRQGEILGLTPGCVFENKIIVKKQWARLEKGIYGFSILKNGKKGEREIPINKVVYDSLHSLPFNFKENRFFKANVIAFTKFLDLSPHDFRHTLASKMVQNNFNLKYVAYILGDTLDTVIKTYVGLNDEMVQEQHKKFCAVFVPSDYKTL